MRMKAIILPCATLLLALLCAPPAMWGQVRPMPKAAGPTMYQPTRTELGLRGTVSAVTQITRFEGGQDMNKQETWLFDESGSLMRHTVKGFGGEHSTNYPVAREEDKRQQVTRDSDGDITEMRRYASDGHTPLAATYYVYAAAGALAATVTYNYSVADTGMVESRTEAYYNKAGRVARTFQYSADAAPLMQETYKYNCHGDLKRRVQHFYSDGERTTQKETRKYRYDGMGNWVEQTYLMDGKRIYTISRTISYFEQ